MLHLDFRRGVLHSVIPPHKGGRKLSLHCGFLGKLCKQFKIVVISCWFSYCIIICIQNLSAVKSMYYLIDILLFRNFIVKDDVIVSLLECEISVSQPVQVHSC